MQLRSSNSSREGGCRSLNQNTRDAFIQISFFLQFICLFFFIELYLLLFPSTSGYISAHMTFDLVFDEASSTSQTSSSSLDLDRIQQFAAMSLKELHEHWDLSCTSSRLSGSQNISESAPNKTKASNEGKYYETRMWTVYEFDS